MFDIGFTELLLIAVVALVVVGPKELPALIAKLARFVNRARQLASSVKSELDREVYKTEELKRLLSEQQDILARHQRVMEQPHVTATPPTPETSASASAPPAGQGAESPPALAPVAASHISPVPPRSIPAGGAALSHGPAPD